MRGTVYVKYLSLIGIMLAAAWSHTAGADCPLLEGESTQGGLLWGQVSPGHRVYLDDAELPLSAEGIFVFGFHRDTTGMAQLKVQGEKPCELELSVSGREYNIQRIEGVPQRTVTPSAEHTARIVAERELVRRAKAASHDKPLFAKGFQWPLKGPITGVYGSQRVYNGTPKAPHYGVDVAAPTGTPAYAPAAGKIVLTHDNMFYSGGTVIIDHGLGVNSSFLHLSKILVKEGDWVEAGDLVAEVGATGRVTGPHLDWRMSWRNRRIDPQFLVPPMP